MPVAVSQPTSSKDSGFISGDLWIDAGIEYFMSSFDDQYTEAVQAAAAEATIRLRSAAAMDADWSELAPLLKVVPDIDGMNYIIDGTEEEQAQGMALEYGGPGQDPRPLLRRAAAQDLDLYRKMIKVEGF